MGVHMHTHEHTCVPIDIHWLYPCTIPRTAAAKNEFSFLRELCSSSVRKSTSFGGHSACLTIVIARKYERMVEELPYCINSCSYDLESTLKGPERWFSSKEFFCSSRRSKFGSQHPQWAAHNSLHLWLQGIWCLWPPRAPTHMWLSLTQLRTDT